MDEIDYRILRELRFNARITNTELAERVGLSPSPCWKRFRNLEKQGVIEKYVTVFSQTALGLPDTVILEVRLAQHDEKTIRRFEEELATLPEVEDAYLMTGPYDFYIKIAVNGTKDYETFLRQRIYKIPGVSHTRSSFALRCLKQSPSLLPSAAPLAAGGTRKKTVSNRRSAFS